MKKYLALLLALVLAFGVVLTACGGDKAPATTAPKADAGNDATDAPTEPAELRQLTVFGANPQWGVDENDMKYWMTEDHVMYQYFVETMKEDLNIEFVPEIIDYVAYAQTVQNRVNADLDLPDIINLADAEFSTNEIIKLGQQGVLLELTSLFEQYDEDGSIMEFLTRFPEFFTCFDENGDLWYMPYVNSTPATTAAGEITVSSCYAFQLRKDWMDALGIEYKVFMTPDEIFDILKAFRDNDANGNGLADEVIKGLPGDTAFVTGFGIGDEMIYSLSDGTCGAQIDHPNFPELVKFYQRMYQEGIISAEQFNDGGFDALSANRYSGFANYATQTWQEPSVVGYEDTAYYVPVVVDDDGGANGFDLPWADPVTGMLGAWGVYKDADPEAVVDFFDWLCSDYYVKEWSRGVQGFHWDYDENGEVVNLLEGKELDPYTETGLNSAVFYNWVPNMRVEGWATPEEWYDMAAPGLTDYPEKLAFEYDILIQEKYGEYRYGNSNFFANMTDAESEAWSLVYNDVKTYWDELRTDLMIGEKSLDDLATYRKEIGEMGLDTLIKIAQDQAARYWAAVEAN